MFIVPYWHSYDWQKKTNMYATWDILFRNFQEGSKLVLAQTQKKKIKWLDSAVFDSKSPSSKERSKYSSNDQNLYWFLFCISSSKLRFLTGWMSVWMILFEIRIQALGWVLPCIPEPQEKPIRTLGS